MGFDQELSLREIMERWIESSPEFDGMQFYTIMKKRMH